MSVRRFRLPAWPALGLCALAGAVCLAVAHGTVAAQEQLASPTLVALFETAGNLGFTTIRAAFSPPDQPMPQAAAAWAVTDYTNVARWSASNAPCIAFDNGRFSSAAALAGSGRAAAAQMSQMATQLVNDYRGALQQTRCAFGFDSPQQRDQFFLTGLSMGFATARASYYYYEGTPTPAAVADQIRGDLSAVRNGLQSMQACMPSAAAVDGQIQNAVRRVGTVAGQDAYNEIAGIYVTIENGLKATSCTAAAPPAPVGGSCPAGSIPPACSASCAGAVSLLGVLSNATPQCQACIANSCR